MAYETYIGLLAAMLTTFAFLPQALKVIKTKQTKDISLFMYIIFVCGILLWLIYGLIINNIPIIFANILSFILSGTILVLKLKYK